MKPFKFLRTPLFTAHDGGDVYAGEHFYTMNKEEFPSVNGGTIPKYTIVTRCIHPKFKDKFKPDHEVLWYFRSIQNAVYLRTIWEREDRMTSGGENMHHNSDITITFNR
jgi:hypothetical protein